MIWHLDLDCFYVSAERLRNPKLNGLPVAIGQKGPRCVISSASYEARKFGVRSAQPTDQAIRLCPELILVPVDIKYYSAISKQVFEVLKNFTPIYEIVSIDEAYLDMRGSQTLFGPPVVAAETLRQEIKNKTGLTASIGIASNRLVAKIATDLGKPNNIYFVAPGTEAQTLAPLDVGKLPGCGKKTESWLKERGIHTIGQLQTYPCRVLDSRLGKLGKYLQESALGIGSTEFNQEPETRSISRETTFSDDLENREIILKHFREMASDLALSLRAENVFCRTIRLKLRYPPFHTLSRSRTLTLPTQSDQGIFDAAVELLDENWEQGVPLRLVGIGCVICESQGQLSLFSVKSKQELEREKLDRLRDKIRNKFGTHIVKTPKDFETF